MSEYQTEEEQVEAIKRWWKENGTSVIAGLVIGLGGVFGWQAWGNYQDRIGAEAALAFNQMVAAVDRGDKPSAVKQAELMRSNYDNSYAIFAAMAEARVKLDQGDAATAISRLEWASENADNPSLKQLVQLSLARVLLNEGELDAAEKQVASEQGGFAGEFAVIRGDIAFARGDKAAAAEAYTQAMTLEVSNRNLLQMKLDDLAATTP
ncbi:MAG: tetratricopeptide repeat protein [Candidatus Thiodiazotropha taylori]|uniref:Ancillary SecYEG translocon subunit n=1 Tax=Candidatus Thiodiazotropha taylori TaxID=2792791 RepID=A0A9E4TUJ9_9GAMM|nr:tetratricopeptide repeat protein [Candidatus Thiodiazotropha taylori]MCW4223401.1 tetratricopeptide repeat protein [Candidatus Thiodiazotropha endolucinida]MCG7881402.1 tetratricopeptide repeat protein [Candidatus Thiodiazotropha taylori]MCG7884978.1 tetratricopeptide repeat protein [Candidatus Thiodiazotropha taylori]MCG7890969.1 tetratricopeptide repeat protein [Candidatus Thiodiazotropha taylori]